MKKDKKFLKDLEENLEGISQKNKDAILEKYRNLIIEGKESKKKITVIIKELGDPKEIASKEKELLGKESFVVKFKEKFNSTMSSLKNKMKRDDKEKKEKKVKKEKVKKEKKEKIDKSLEKNRKELKKQIKKEKRKLKKELKAEIKEKNKKEKQEKKEKKEKKNKKSFKESIIGIGSFLVKDRELRKKEKKEPIESIKEVVEEVKEEVKEEITEVSEIVAEKKIFESKKERNKRILLRTLGVLLTILLLFVWLWVTVVFIATIFAYLDGVKFIGLIIGLFGVVLLLLWIVIMINRLIFNKKSGWKINLIVTVITLIIIAVGIVLFVNQLSKIKTVKDVSVKYSMTSKFDTYSLPSDPNQKFTVIFNSNYDTQYTINYDETLKDKVKIDVKYYECYYDYFIKKTANSVYISLKLDNRDRLSVYIDDLKEGLVFDNDELSRYTVKITINPDDVQRLVIQD